MTPAIIIAKQHKIKHTIHEYIHDASSTSYGQEACEKLAVSASTVFKTLVVKLDSKELAVAIVPVTAQLNLKLMAKILKVKKAEMALPSEVERSTGYVLGGVSPLGQKKRLRAVLDDSAKQLDSIFVSAGRRGLEIELSPQDLIALLNAQYAHISKST